MGVKHFPGLVAVARFVEMGVDSPIVHGGVAVRLILPKYLIQCRLLFREWEDVCLLGVHHTMGSPSFVTLTCLVYVCSHRGLLATEAVARLAYSGSHW